jgi:hypothetical protein
MLGLKASGFRADSGRFSVLARRFTLAPANHFFCFPAGCPRQIRPHDGLRQNVAWFLRVSGAPVG